MVCPQAFYMLHCCPNALCTARLISQEHPNPDPSLPVNGYPSLPQHAQPTLNGTATSAHPSLTSSPFPTNPPHPGPSTTPVSFTQEQINILRAQIHAFRALQRGHPVPAELQNIIRPPQSSNPEVERLLSTQLVAKVVDNSVKIQKASSEVPPTPVAETPATSANQVHPLKLEGTPRLDDASKAVLQEEDPDAPMYPYNAYVHPFTHLKMVGSSPEAYATRLQRLLIPSIMPLGLDPHQLIDERRRFVEARIQQRIRELEAMPSTIGDGGLEPIIDDESKENVVKPQQEVSHKLVNLEYVHPPATAHGKLRAVIELRSLRVLDKQRALRAMVAERLTHGSLLPLNRSDFRRARKPTIRDTHMTETLERKQRVDRERRAKQKHVEQLGIICAHGRKVLDVNRAAQDRAIRLHKAVLSFHTHAEREEQKRIERISKERLKALKADDEEAYMKLIDTAKDTRITHLLKQTDTYLDSLAQAVLAQQIENPLEPVEEVTSEETFGAPKLFDDDPQDEKGKIDYYAVAHRIKEKVVKQPTLLIGGTLKDYQLKGLQWMVSLYNNRLNGILADEMVISSSLMLPA
jgi:ATP-dependent helicase STH1/SNF2